MTERRLDVWAKVPGGRETTGWSRIAAKVTIAEADVYEETCLYKVHIEVSHEGDKPRAQ